LAALGDRYDFDDAYDRVRTAQNAALDVLLVFGPKAKQLLTAEQIRKLPTFISVFLDAASIRRMRPGAGFGGPVMVEF
jgi:hypothetical protein